MEKIKEIESGQVLLLCLESSTTNNYNWKLAKYNVSILEKLENPEAMSVLGWTSRWSYASCKICGYLNPLSKLFFSLLLMIFFLLISFLFSCVSMAMNMKIVTSPLH